MVKIRTRYLMSPILKEKVVARIKGEEKWRRCV